MASKGGGGGGYATNEAALLTKHPCQSDRIRRSTSSKVAPTSSAQQKSQYCGSASMVQSRRMAGRVKGGREFAEGEARRQGGCVRTRRASG